MTNEDLTTPRQYQGVTISSTFTDLEDHRAALIKAIKSNGLTDVGMENDSAKVGLDVIDSSLQMVRDGSAYLGIISHKYGQTPKCAKRNPKNLSITELEFDEAQRLKRPILLFIMGDDHQVTIADVETNARKKKKLKAFREKAKKMTPESEVHRIYATFESLEDFKEKCGAAVAGLRRHLDELRPFPHHTPESVVAAMVPQSRKHVPSTLPSQPYFFGREKELGIIAEAIAPEARTWGALIDGPGGIGKTAVAIRASHLAPDSHFDRKMFLSAKVRELTPQGEQKLEDFLLPNYMALLTELARELGEDNIERLDPSERPNAVRRALADTRVLIVIDNVETFPEPERVRLYQFLSRLPTTCKAIVTSRRRADIDARVVRLDRLEQKDALDLIEELARTNRHLAKATEDERRDLYEITNGNPQLIKWAVGQLGRKGSQCRTIPEVCDFLKNAPAENNPLEYIFGDLLDTFTESETKILAALVHFKQPADVRVISEVSGLAKSVAVTALEDLTDRSLLLSDEGQQTFLLPTLAGSFLRRKRTEVIADTGRRMVDRVYSLAIENGYRSFDRFPKLEAEWLAIDAALQLLKVGENERLQKVCDALDNFLNFSGRWDELIALCEFAEEKAVAAGDLHNAGWRACDLGWIFYLRGEVKPLLGYVERCAHHWENTPRAGSYEKAAVARLRAMAHKIQGNHSEAIAALKEALELHREGSASASVAYTLNDLASVEKTLRNYGEAERYFREALQTAQTVNDPQGIAIITGNLSALSLDLKDWTTAEEQARKSLELTERIGRQEMIGLDCARLAKALAHQGRPEVGLPYAERAVQIFTHLRQPERLEYSESVLKLCLQ